MFTTNGQAKELPTYKDNDFINDGQKIYIDEENKKMFLEKLRKDVEVCFDHEWKWLSVLFLFLGMEIINTHVPPVSTLFCSSAILLSFVVLSSWPS